MSHSSTQFGRRGASVARSIGAAALVLATASYVQAQEWEVIKDPGQTRALLSNKTLTGLGADGRPATWYFRSDGAGLRISEGVSTQRTWDVKPDATYCVTDAAGTYCFRLERNARRLGELRATLEPGLHVFEFQVTDGVPAF